MAPDILSYGRRPAAALAVPPAPAPRPASSPCPWLSSVLSATDPNTDTRGGLRHPPHAICKAREFLSKNHSVGFCPQGKPRQQSPPGLLSPQKIKNKNPAWVAGGVGLGPWRRRGRWGWLRRTPGRVAR